MKKNIKNIVMYVFSGFFILLAVISLAISETLVYKLYSFTLLLMYAAIFAIIADFKGIRKHIPLFNKNKSGYTILGVIACVLILIIYAIVFNNFYELPEHKDTNNSAEQIIDKETDITNFEENVETDKSKNNNKENISEIKKDKDNSEETNKEYEYIYNALKKGDVPPKALKKTADVFYRCGLIDIEDVELSLDNEDLKLYRCWYKNDNRLQINFTYENYDELFYVQLTGLHKVENDFYRNWRGKIKYGIVDKQVSVDMYDYGTKAIMNYEKNIVYPYKYRNEKDIEKYSVPIDTDR